MTQPTVIVAIIAITIIAVTYLLTRTRTIRVHDDDIWAIARAVSEEMVRDEMQGDLLELSTLDEVLGVDEDEARLIEMHGHDDNEMCQSYMLSIPAGMEPSAVLRPYPALRDRKDLGYVPSVVDDQHRTRIELSQVPAIHHSEVDFPFDELSIVFCGPADEAMVIDVEVIVGHLAAEYARFVAPMGRTAVIAAFNAYLERALPMPVTVDAARVAPRR